MASPRRIGWALGGGAAATLALAIVTAALHRADAAEPAPPLAPVERSALAAASPVVHQLAMAIEEVPRAATDLAAGTSASSATRRIAEAPSLAPLAEAIARPNAFAHPIVVAFDAARHGHAVPYGAEQISGFVDRVELVEGEILPAVRLVAASAGRPTDQPTALERLDADDRLVALRAVLAGWPQIYGALALLEQAASTT
ncbi:MAG TPA: hypothetical protein VG708_13000 [Mycobacteriales bacterium]|nr:hypothetical protein [Mycobacteriales bacterium]